MSMKLFLAGLAMLAGAECGVARAQSSQSTQATSPGQSGASNTIPQPPSGGRPATGGSASGPETGQEKQADTQAKKATGSVCQGC